LGKGDIERRLRLKEHKIDRDQRYRVKRSELDEVLEEVFDKTTLMTLYGMMNKGLIYELHGVISAGKESRIYHAINRDKEELAVKIYLVNNVEFRKTRMTYVVNDPRFREVPPDLRDFIYLWARREYSNLQLAHQAGVAVPRPIAVQKNVLIMSFLGKDGVRYHLLRERGPTQSECEKIYRSILREIHAMYRDAGLVHSDLSEYNIMLSPSLEPFLIDLSQAVHTSHPLADNLLIRDLKNVNNFFQRLGVSVLTEGDAFKEITGREFWSGGLLTNNL